MKAALIATGIVGLLAGPCAAQWWWPPTDGLTVMPECLDPTTVVNLTVSGLWPDACIPNYSHTQVTGNVVDFFTVRDPPPGGCLTVITNWSRTEPVGPLSPGVYTVFATHLVAGQVVLPRVEVGSFQVGPPCPGSCYPNCDGSTTDPVLNIADFTCFLNRFAAGDGYANCDGSATPPVLNIGDFTCFLNRFAAGCT